MGFLPRTLLCYNSRVGHKYFYKLPHEATIATYYILFNFYNNDR
jgi:hypothetical protein